MALLRRITLIVMTASAALTGGVIAPINLAHASGVPAPGLMSPANDPSTAVKDSLNCGPNNDATCGGLVLKWHSVPGASAYQLQISPNGDFTNNKVSLDGNGMTLNTLYEVPMTLPHTTYYWRVRANVGGTWGPYSGAWQFLRQWEAHINVVKEASTADPTIEWAPVPGASLYRVTFFTYPPGFPDSRIDVGECATDETSLTPYSIDSNPPNQPLGEQLSPYAHWPFAQSNCGLPNGTPLYYRVEAYDDTIAELLAADTAPNPTSGPFPEPPSGPSPCYQAPECDASTLAGTASPTSAVHGPFTYQESPAAGSGSGGTITNLQTTWHASTVTPVSCDATTACPITPTFSWNPDPNTSCYIVTIYRDQDTTNVYWDFSTRWTTFTPPDSIFDAQPGRPYYWRVLGVHSSNGCGSQAPTMCQQATSTGTTAAPTVTAVAASPSGTGGSNTAVGGTTTTVTLTGTGFANGACVQSSAGAVTNVSVVSGTKITFTYAAPADGGSETFKVFNTDGGTSGDSPPLTVSASIVATSGISSFDKRSDPLTLVSPAPNATEHGSTFTFRWNSLLAAGSKGSYDARNYWLQVDTDSNFSKPIVDIQSIDDTQYTSPTSLLANGHYYWRVAPVDEVGDPLTWSATRQVTVNATGPQVSIVSPSGIGTLHPIRINFSEVVQGVNASTLRIVPDGKPASQHVAGTVTLGATPKQYVFHPSHPFASGGTYDVWVSPFLADANGNPAQVAGNPVRISTEAKNTNSGWTYSGAWSRSRASGARSGSYASANAGSSARLQVAGKVASLYACKGPGMGTISVTVNGNTQTVSENQSFTRCGTVIWHRSIPDGIQTLTVSVLSGTGNIDEVSLT